MFTHAVPGSVLRRAWTALQALVWRRVGKVNPPGPPVPHVGGTLAAIAARDLTSRPR